MKILKDAIKFTRIFEEIKKVIIDDKSIPDIWEIDNLTKKITERLMEMEKLMMSDGKIIQKGGE